MPLVSLLSFLQALSMILMLVLIMLGSGLLRLYVFRVSMLMRRRSSRARSTCFRAHVSLEYQSLRTEEGL